MSSDTAHIASATPAARVHRIARTVACVADIDIAAATATTIAGVAAGPARTPGDSFPFRLYLVVSESSCLGRDFVDVTRRAIEGGVDIVQLREKGVDDTTFLERALRLQEVLSRCDIPLIINDNIRVAQHCGAYGIHVGASDISPTQIRAQWPDCQSIGYSIESLSALGTEAARAADCFGVSPVFSTPSKTDTITEWGLEGIAQIRALTSKPLIAIGNMNAGNAREVIRAGADCIAVISAICAAADPAQAAEKIRNEIDKTL